MAEESDGLAVEDLNGAVLLRFDRPERRNALSLRLMEALGGSRGRRAGGDLGRVR